MTQEAAHVVSQLRTQHGALMFHLSGGCCDGSSPMCFPEGQLFLNHTDICIGEVEGCPFYMARDQFEYWKHTELTVSITEGRGSSFSLEIPLGLRFIIQSRMFTDKELNLLQRQEEVPVTNS
ncbi:MAG: DUF779 domain-containing protein [Bacteroidota bacterium]